MTNIISLITRRKAFLILLILSGIVLTSLKNARMRSVTIDGSWNLEKEVEKRYVNQVLVRDTTRNFVLGDMNMTFYQGKYTIFEDSAALDTGSFKCYDDQLLLTEHGDVVNYKILSFDPEYGTLVIAQQQYSRNLNDSLFLDVTESHFKLSGVQ